MERDGHIRLDSPLEGKAPCFCVLCSGVLLFLDPLGLWN